ncbi:family 20 glycosylhydrolase [Nonomuraea rubra]|uniref:beta-N-acetylhexosaminidase n=1 Tax=Nonomuraea rubra TaxID=46180 RepID=A0A7X0TW38_9ACTN|nr:family 20 glycosylhydrolase [Nonomuraea rubra]MBB6545774.1 hexosaminidase [Nonomuraea rubra]
MHVVPLPRHLSPAGQGVLELGGSPRVAVPSGRLLGLGRIVAALLGGSAQVGGEAEVTLTLGAGDGEEYELVVTAEGATVTAGSAEGLFRGATTVAQLVTEDRTVPCVRAGDGPALAWRGLSLDVARRFFTVEQVKRVIDLLALYKFNVLHLHLTDSQAWRLRISAWPRLTGPESYTHDDYREIVAYAAERFVTVVPEIDMPGHVLAAVRAYPELGGEDEPAHPLVPFLDPRAEVTWRFVADVLGEVAVLTPGPYLHIGGDEAFGMPHELYAAFVTRALGLARAAGKRVVGWQEVSRSGALTSADLAQCWVGDGDAFDPEAARKTAPPQYHPLIDLAAAAFEQAPHDVPGAVAAGAAVLASPSRVLYLDRRYAEPSVLEEQNERRERVGFASYRPMTSREYFGWRPGELVEIPAGARLAGVEAAIWCETVGDFDDLAFLLLPRLAGIAEKAWTDRATTWEDYRERVRTHTARWERLGWGGYYRSADLFT